VHLWGKKKQGTQIDTYHDHDLLKPLSHFFSIPYIFFEEPPTQYAGHVLTEEKTITIQVKKQKQQQKTQNHCHNKNTRPKTLGSNG
jgi:hypothetical protein